MTDQMKDRIKVMLHKAFEQVGRDKSGKATWTVVREAMMRSLYSAGQDPIAAEHFLELSKDEQDRLLEGYAMKFLND